MRIAIIGQLRAGKSTAMTIFQELSDNQFRLMKMGELIYKETRELYARYDLPYQKNRKLLESIGEVFNFAPQGDLLVKYFDYELNAANPLLWVICDDARTSEQIIFLKKRTFVLIRVETDAEVRKSRCKGSEWNEGHYTDNQLFEVKPDYILDGNLALNRYRENIIYIYDELMSKNNAKG
jgi:hypothetical protein